MAKHRFRKAWRSARAQSRLTVTQVTATSLAAITMAVVSARLTSFSSSILIVGVISAISAFASEFYRIVITASAEGTKKAVAPILEVESHGSGEGGGVGTAGSTEEDVADTVVSATAEGSDVATTRVLAPERPAGSGGADPVGTPSTEEGGAADTGKPKHPFLNALRHNQLLQMSIIFLIVALITVGVSYGVARAQGKTEINNNYTTVEQTLTEEQKQQVLDEAAQVAKEQVTQTGTDQQATDQTTTDQGTAEQPADTTVDEGVQAELDALKTENEGLRTSVETLTAQLDAEKVRTDDLAERLAALEALLAAQGAQTPTG